MPFAETPGARIHFEERGEGPPLGIGRAVWAGLSIGGMVALRAALERPGRVAGLVLLDTDAGAETTLAKWKYRAMGWTARALGMRPLLPAVARLMFGETTRETKPELVEAWKGRFAATHVPSMLTILDALVRRDAVVDRLGGIDVATLVLVGEEDEALPPDRSREIAAGIPGAGLELVPEAGHLTALERPGVVTGAMAEFLEGMAET
ncbi:MAG: alpha/beta fold hydrolase [Gemmatimonadota bacterium]|nr:alpha/beta fold hydrolase [Gemmatimonadota bacterium]